MNQIKKRAKVDLSVEESPVVVVVDIGSEVVDVEVYVVKAVFH
jgi:hypothetical protein